MRKIQENETCVLVFWAPKVRWEAEEKDSIKTGAHFMFEYVCLAMFC